MDVIVFFNIRRKFILAIGQMIFIAMGAWMYFKSALLTSYLVRNETFIQIVGIISIFYFGLMFLFSLKVYFRKVALVISDKGIYDSSNSLSVGFIPWNEVLDIRQIQEGAVFMIMISLIDSNFIINNEKNFVKRFLLKKQDKRLGSPIIIPMVALNSYVDTLERQLKEKWTIFKHSH